MVRFYDIGNYLVYSDGKVWSKKYNKYLKPWKNGGGYLKVRLDSNLCTVHQLVMLCFGDWRSDLTVNHIDEDIYNNNLSNLEMVTIKDNIRYSASKSVIRSDGKIYQAMNDVKLDGFYQSKVSDCCRGKAISHKGFKWRYYNETTTSSRE